MMTAAKLSPNRAMSRCQELAVLVTQQTDKQGNGAHKTAIPQLALVRESTVSTNMSGLVEPTFALMVQGKKETLLGEEIYQYSAAQYLVVSVDLPLRAFIVEATPNKPYLGFKLSLDPSQICDIIGQIQTSPAQPKISRRGLFVSDADVSLIDCAIRLTQLLDTPQDISFLAPMIIREMYYRLLSGEQSEAIRQIATTGSSMQRVAAVIKRLKAEFANSLRINELAEQINMSPASFYRHFKEVTSMSPLQYQKQLRLLEARRLMLAEIADATQAAYQVGYESTSQFSREYSRMFGAPPIQDIERLRSA